MGRAGPTAVRNTVALLAGTVGGGAVNSALIALGPSLVPAPAGGDVPDAASLSAGMHRFEPRHFVMPFLAHAAGTFVGALAAYYVAATHAAGIALAVGVVFLTAG